MIDGMTRTPILQPSPGRGLTRYVLVVDDEQPIREIIAEVLDEEGYRVEQAANGREALRKLQLGRPDAIVLDLMMPEMDGWEFARTCGAQHADNPIPILIMSASPELTRSAEQLRPSGVRAAIPKPFDVDVFLAVVGRLANRAAAVEWPG